MKITDRHRSAARALEKCRDGGSITDEEIRNGLSVLDEIIPALSAMGDHFYIAFAELNRRRSEIESYRDARKRA